MIVLIAVIWLMQVESLQADNDFTREQLNNMKGAY